MKNYLQRNLFKHQYDTLALQQINSLVNSYLPLSSSAIRPSGLKLILNDIIINGREVIFEIGSGISTVYLEALTRHYPIKIYSLDHSPEWQEIVKKMIITNNGSVENIIWIHADLINIKIDEYEGLWYDFEVIKNHLLEPINQLIVDGPISVKGQEKIRYPALPYFKDYLSDNFCVFLDDTHREEEKNISLKWANQYSLKLRDYTIHSDSSTLTSGETYNIL